MITYCVLKSRGVKPASLIFLFQAKRDKKMDRGKDLKNLQSSMADIQNLFRKRSGIGQGSNLNNLQNELNDAYHLFNVRC